MTLENKKSILDKLRQICLEIRTTDEEESARVLSVIDAFNRFPCDEKDTEFIDIIHSVPSLTSRVDVKISGVNDIAYLAKKYNCKAVCDFFDKEMGYKKDFLWESELWCVTCVGKLSESPKETNKLVLSNFQLQCPTATFANKLKKLNISELIVKELGNSEYIKVSFSDFCKGDIIFAEILFTFIEYADGRMDYRAIIRRNLGRTKEEGVFCPNKERLGNIGYGDKNVVFYK